MLPLLHIPEDGNNLKPVTLVEIVFRYFTLTLVKSMEAHFRLSHYFESLIILRY